MKISFRQGIVRYQTDINNTPAAVIKSALDDRYLDLVVSPDPTLIAFCHGDADYLVEESKTVREAWGPFPANGQTQHLFWDLDIASGSLSRGHTIFTPIVSLAEPTVQREDQHWFDESERVMKVYMNGKWRIKLRVFAGVYSSSAIFQMKPANVSQVGLNDIDNDIGLVVYDRNKQPIRTREGHFVTTTRTLITHTHSENVNTTRTGFRIEQLMRTVKSRTLLPKFSVVSMVEEDIIELASYLRPDRIVSGIIIEEAFPNEYVQLISNGRIHDTNLNLDISEINKPIFADEFGRITTSPPPTGISQIIGFVIDTDTIEIRLQTPYIIDPTLGS